MIIMGLRCPGKFLNNFLLVLVLKLVSIIDEKYKSFVLKLVSMIDEEY